MPALLPDVDPDGLLEYSVVFTDRSLNHMSADFQQVMRDSHEILTDVYGAREAVIVPGGGTYAMEAVARQFAAGQRVLIIRNGYFSYRWSQILEQGGITPKTTVLQARQAGTGPTSPFVPVPIDAAVEVIHREQPDIVFAPHVETSAGMMLPDDYLATLGAAVRENGGLFVLDCIASGCMWVDMPAHNVDVLISAPQKGWSGSPCAGLVMLDGRAVQRVEATVSSSFAIDLGRWRQIMLAYQQGGHAYHATMPTDALRRMRDTMLEAREYGFERLRDAQARLGQQVRAVLEARGCASVAAPGFQAPGVVVSYTDDAQIRNGSRFAAAGLQIAAGVPLMCDEPEGFSTFRIGLFGLDKLMDVDGCVARLETALAAIE